MQTFLPVPDFKQSLRCLDTKRAGKQRVEAFQIIRCLTIQKNRWFNHPAVQMWAGYENALKEYYNISILTWIERGYRNTMQNFQINGPVLYPSWFGYEEFHASHRSNLLRKKSEWYGQFGWTERNDLPYYWPTHH
jgi:hypothetical protein